jgi:hypothetical protein
MEKPTMTIGFKGARVSRQYICPSAKTLLYGSVVLVDESGAPQLGQKSAAGEISREQPRHTMLFFAAERLSSMSGITLLTAQIHVLNEKVCGLDAA